MALPRVAAAGLALLLATPVALAAPGALRARNAASMATAAGRSYEMRAVAAFWGDAAFMAQCAPAGARPPASLEILFEVTLDGRLGALEISPRTDVAACIDRAVRDRVFPPPPPGGFVGRIELQFGP